MGPNSHHELIFAVHTHMKFSEKLTTAHAFQWQASRKETYDCVARACRAVYTEQAQPNLSFQFSTSLL